MLGYDENHKPRAARFPAKDADLVTKAAQLMDLRVYEAASEDLAALAKKLPEGRLYGNGRGFVPNIRQSLYSQIIVTLAVEPQAAVGKDQDELPVATGLPRTWDEIAPGHLVIAQEGLDHGWWEADRPRSQRRHVHVAVSGLPEAAQVCSPSSGSRVDEPSGRITSVGGPGSPLRPRGRRLPHPDQNPPHRLAHPPSAAASPRTDSPWHQQSQWRRP